jgi:hypothetical protein
VESLVEDKDVQEKIPLQEVVIDNGSVPLLSWTPTQRVGVSNSTNKGH